jgi:hypothetical protein
LIETTLKLVGFVSSGPAVTNENQHETSVSQVHRCGAAMSTPV